jgi:hypothetical protein
VSGSPSIPSVDGKKIYPTLSGLPLSFSLEWPFHQSKSGADFWVLHGDIRLENSAELHAPIAVNLSATVREVLPSLDPKDVEAPVINALRKQVDRRQVEFVKSGKLVPVHFSSRFYDFKNKKWVFGKTSDEEITRLLLRKIYWQTLIAPSPVWLGDPVEALYVETTVEHFLEIAGKLKQDGLITLQGDSASANAALMAQKEKFDTEMQSALSEIETKYAFERG